MRNRFAQSPRLYKKLSTFIALSKTITPAILLFGLILSPSTSHAGAWLQPENEGQIILSGGYHITVRQFDTAGNRSSNSYFAKSDITPYIEYGLTDDWTIGAKMSFERMNSDGSYFVGPGEASLFARTEIWKDKDTVWSIEPGLSYPLDSAGQINPEGDHIIPELRLNFGQKYSWLQRKHFLNMSLGYRYRDDDNMTDMATLEITNAFTIDEDWAFMAQGFQEQSFGGYSKDPANYNVTKLQLSGLYNFDDYKIQAGWFNNVYGRNTRGGNGVFLALWYNY